MNIQESTVLMKAALVFAQIIAIYNLLIWIRIIFTWFTSFSPMTNNGFYNILKQIVDPYLNLFRNVNFLKTKSIDFTPLLAFALLSVVQSILRLYGATGEITLFLILALILNTLWSYLISPFLLILTILIIVRLVLCFKKGPNTISFIRGIENIIGGFLNWIQKIFFFSKIVSDRTLLITSTVFTILVYLLTRAVITGLISYLISL